MTMTTIQCLVDASQVPTTYLSDISLATLYCFVQFFPKEINLCGHYDIRLLKATLRQKPLYVLKYFGYNYVYYLNLFMKNYIFHRSIDIKHL